tara:strand:+ start:1687 stop:2973 length:1287 start_codon:yes stop_codon:yes gene_type:complete
LITPIITICGRPNVGKSTLFNRIVGKRKSIVSEIPGTTRDAIQSNCSWKDMSFILVDSGGIELDSMNQLTRKVQLKSYDSIRESNQILFLVDAKEGITNIDKEILREIRKFDKEILLVINKADNENLSNANDFYSLGLGDGIKISAYHDLGIYELMESIDHLFSEKKVDDESIKFSIVGRPNVGKSTIFNSMLGDSISIVDSTPGTTRDSVDSTLNYNDDLFTIVDTAGIRRKGKIGKEIEYFSVIRTISSVSESNISLLVIDSTEQITLQDQHIAGLIIQSGNGCVVAMNKVDLLNKKIDESKLIEKLKFFPGVPIIYTSGLKNNGIDKILENIKTVNLRYQLKIDDDDIWRNLVDIVSANLPPSKGKRSPYLTSAKQIGSKPPKILLKFKNVEYIHFSYKRYIENELRKIFDLKGVPLQLEFREND